MNIRLTLEYDGSGFCGWQRQDGHTTIQGIIESALNEILRQPTTLYGASRTDSGVHAEGQVANFFTTSSIPPARWRLVLNTVLPPGIRIIESSEVPECFHSQKHALSKIYRYRVLNRGFSSALDRRVYFYPREICWDRIKEALTLFVGEKDFRAFQAANADTKTTIRRIDWFNLEKEEEGTHRFTIQGNGFLKQMVRTIIGTVIEVGEGRRTLGEIEETFISRDRRLAGRTVPAAGLTLVRVHY